MVIDTLNCYHPLYQLPIYVKLAPPEHNDYRVGKKYDMRVEDSERQSEKGGKGPFNYVHETLLIGKQEYEFSDVPDILLALLGNTKSREDAIETVSVDVEGYDSDRELVLLTFLRLDCAKEFIQNGKEIIPNDMDRESVEGNGRSTVIE